MAKILVIEDDEMIRTMITIRLSRSGYDVLAAADGVHGITLAKTQRPDLVLMDMGLPVLTGWQVAQRLKSSPTTGTIPIIALTAFALSDDREKCLQAGCDEYETKPVDFAALFEKMERLLKTTVAAT